jgi:hypothetical protein
MLWGSCSLVIRLALQRRNEELRTQRTVAESGKVWLGHLALQRTLPQPASLSAPLLPSLLQRAAGRPEAVSLETWLACAAMTTVGRVLLCGGVCFLAAR